MEEIQDIQNQITNKLIKNLSNKLDNIVIKGLKRKGYEFDNVSDLQEFVKGNCHIEQFENTKTFYVKKLPFLYIEEETKTDVNGDKATVSLGDYRYM